MQSSTSQTSPRPVDMTARLFAEHQLWLLQRLSYRLRNRADAEDLTSETFLRVITRPEVATLQAPRAYLATVAKRLLINLWHRRELEQAYLDAISVLPQAVAPSPEERALLIESLEAIAQALQAQSDKARRAFLMSQLDGLTYAQIAQQLGVSASMVLRYMAQCWEACWHLRQQEQSCLVAALDQPLQIAPSQGRPLQLRAGRTIWLSAQGARAGAEEAAAAAAWESGNVAVHDRPLSKVVEGLRAYRAGQPDGALHAGSESDAVHQHQQCAGQAVLLLCQWEPRHFRRTAPCRRRGEIRLLIVARSPARQRHGAPTALR
ncbi:MAG: sigma-70 family RNA polymerase sigma factor [Comamonas sp.]